MLTIFFYVSSGFLIAASFADYYTTLLGLGRPGFKEKNPFSFSKNPTVDALVKCVALPVAGLAVGAFWFPLPALIYNSILGLGTAFVAFMNYRQIK